MHRLLAVQQPIDAAPKGLVGGIIAKIHSAPQLTELSAGLMQSRLAGGGAEALQQVSRRAVPIVNGCRHAQQFVEFRVDEVQIDVPAQDRFESRDLWPAARQVQPLMAHVMLPWTQVKSQQLADTETQMRVYMDKSIFY